MGICCIVIMPEFRILTVLPLAKLSADPELYAIVRLLEIS